MPIDFTKPVKTDNYDTGMLSSIRAHVVALACMLEPTAAGALTSTPTGARRFNNGNGLFESFNGTAWAEQATAYAKAALYLPLTGGTLTGAVTSTAFIPSGATVPVSGMFLPVANAVALATATTERLRVDAAGVLGLGVVPSSWAGSGASVFEFGGAGNALLGNVSTINTTFNAYFSSGWKYGRAGAASYVAQTGGDHIWYTASSGAANAAITWAERMRVNVTGNVTINAPSSGVPLAVSGAGSTFYSGSAAALSHINVGRTSSEARVAVSSSANDFLLGSVAGDALFYNVSGGRGIFGTAGAFSSEIWTNNVQRLVITSAGVIQDAAGIELGWKDIPQNIQVSAYTLAVGDRGKHIAAGAGVTVPNAVFAAGNAVTIYNNTAASITITQGTSHTLRLAGTATTGNRTLAQRGMATILFLDGTVSVISGAGLT